MLGGCAVGAGSPTSESSWRTDTDKALGSALSSLGTARLVLDSEAHGRLPDAYVAVSLRDAIKVLQRQTMSYLAAQPPASKASENSEAVATIQDTVTVLNRAAVAGSSRDRRASAYQDVEAEYAHVEKLQQRLVGR